MERGAYWAGSPLRSAPEREPPVPDSPLPLAAVPAEAHDDAPAVRARASWGERLLLGGLGIAAAAWIAVLATAATTAFTTPPDLVTVARGISLASGPLGLVVAILILWQRNTRAEASRYADVAREVRTETLALDAVLRLASSRLADDRAAVAAEADRLVTISDEASTRLGAVTAALAGGVAALGRESRELDAIAGTARVDMGVLLADLPIAEAQVQALADALRATGLAAGERTQALQAVLEELTRRAGEAEGSGAGAANRLQALLSRMAAAGATAAHDIDATRQRMEGAVEHVLVRASEAIERTHAGVIAQDEAITAMIERARIAADRATEGAAAALQGRIATLRREVEALAALLADQGDVGTVLIERVQQGLATVEARFAELDETARARTGRLGEALALVAQHGERTMATLNSGGTAATTLINRTETLRAAIAACLTDLNETLPEGLARLEQAAARSRQTADEAAPEIERLGGIAAEATVALEVARRGLADRHAAIEADARLIGTQLADATAQATALGHAVADAAREAGTLTESTSPQLVEVLLRVRETAAQAAERARDALAAIVPHSAAALGEAGRTALAAAMGETVEREIGRLSSLSTEAAAQVEAAADRLETQLDRIAQTGAAPKPDGHDGFHGRMAGLVDALNAAAVDVAKLLAKDPGDVAWTAYLKGDRGVFTRRAVRLLDGGEARQVATRYESNVAFRDQVDRYVHDFEALLRPILASGDGSALAVVLLSSDMGKLYVALAQAIERLRT